MSVHVLVHFHTKTRIKEVAESEMDWFGYATHVWTVNFLGMQWLQTLLKNCLRLNWRVSEAYLELDFFLFESQELV